MQTPTTKPMVAIACGGTGGHLFPGVAVAEQLMIRGAAVTLLISPKEVEQQAVKTLRGVGVVTLPAVGLTRGGLLSFAGGFFRSFRQSRALFREKPPAAVLAMGGFTSAPPLLAGRWAGAKTYLHESNTIPGRANRWLAHWVDDAFVYFHETSGRLSLPRVHVTGMPVRPQFDAMDPAAARMTLGLRPEKPTLLVMGGSQGASGINQLVTRALPMLKESLPNWQFIHLTGANDVEAVKKSYADAGVPAMVRPFLSEMEFALGAATLCVSRSGASSLAEIAALRVPSVLVPYPTAADDHQRFNALAFVETGAAWMLDQQRTLPEQLAAMLARLASDEAAREAAKNALAQWHFPNAAEAVAEFIGLEIGLTQGRAGFQPAHLPRSSDKGRKDARPTLVA
jgi:UDP-N-acetylglucosamine--N-acetylmuramyl-(pentapeptide) pyrophosphoryl-undecaprenol N-acetylglucosamine transferase